MSRLLLGLAEYTVAWLALIAAVVWLHHLSRRRDRRIEAETRDSLNRKGGTP